MEVESEAHMIRHCISTLWQHHSPFERKGTGVEVKKRKEGKRRGEKDHLASYQSLMMPDIINKLVISVAIVIPIIC